MNHGYNWDEFKEEFIKEAVQRISKGFMMFHEGDSMDCDQTKEVADVFLYCLNLNMGNLSKKEIEEADDIYLKPKNREWLEKWHAESLVNSVEWWKDYVLMEICMDGMSGAKDYSNRELLGMYKEYMNEVVRIPKGGANGRK